MTSRDGVVLEHFHGARGEGALVAVTTRHGGVSTGPYDSLNLGLHVNDEDERVIENRRRACQSFGSTLDDTVFAQQVHGVGVTAVSARDAGRGTRHHHDAVPDTDILITATAGITLAICVADCVPIAIFDRRAKVLAAVHAGWRGTAGGAVGHALTAMGALDAHPADCIAFLGPGVAASAYQVGAEVRNALADAVAPHVLHSDVARPDGDDHWRVDLVAANRQQLHLVGLDPAQVHESSTSSGDGHHFSDRLARPCGRFALLARLAP
ncbi:MAG TPA: polyphenol oxidase family protein [Acidimicrobiales bacterium]